MKSFTNRQIANMLREVAAAYSVKRNTTDVNPWMKFAPDEIGISPKASKKRNCGQSAVESARAHSIKQVNFFQIRAYETAAEAIEHSTAEAQDLWEEGNLDQIPGIGESLQKHLEELFKTGRVKHWEDVKKDIPAAFFELLKVQGIGPKIALKLSEMGVRSTADLKAKLESGKLQEAGFSEKLGQRILRSLEVNEGISNDRMLLPVAYAQAEKILDYLKQSKDILTADALGSLRRMVATIGDLDFAISSEKPREAVDFITKMPGVAEVLDQGDTKVTLLLNSGLHLDFLISNPGTYGALLQHFTGSKQHNIHLRTLAEKMGLSLSENGAKRVQSGEIIGCRTEEELYGLLGMETPAPEIREDTGEIEAALRQAQGKRNGLPKLVELKDMKGDFHIHDNFPIEPSHDLGASSLDELAEKAKSLGYQYIGIADHSPSVSNHTSQQIIDLIKKRSAYIEQYNSSHKSVRILNLLEVDIQPDGALSVPDTGLELLDFAIASIHSQHQMDKEKMTKRILKALENPYVKILGHPTGRLINRRTSYEADWEVIFKYAAENNIALEINAYPDRLDLPDNLVRIAQGFGVKFSIDSDAHIANELEMMKFGVAVARRGWLTKEDVINSWDWTKIRQWFKI